jgi:hypothetical protein
MPIGVPRMSERHTTTGQQRRSGELRLEVELERRREGHGRPASGPHHAEDLSVCPCCSTDFVYPTDWAPSGQRRWYVSLRCPQCEWRGGGNYDQALVDRFDDVLDETMQSVLDDLELLTRANMEEQIERFVAALDADLILPEDF